MARVTAVIVSSSLLTAQAINNDAQRGKAFLKMKNLLQPELAAKSLVAMEDEWQAEAGIFAECEAHGETEARTECVEAAKHFKGSCDKVVVAVLQGSSGERDSVKQYMDEVCNQDVMQDWHKERCVSLATDVNSLMTADSFENRNAMQTADFCSKMWENIVNGERERASKEADEEAEKAKEEVKLAEEKKQQDAEAAAKAQAEAEAEAKKAAEEKAEAAAAAKAPPAPVVLAGNKTSPVVTAKDTNATEVKK